MEGLRRLRDILRAFVSIGYRDIRAYPISLAINVLAPLGQLAFLYFLAKLIDPGAKDIGGDYFTFAAVGLVSLTIMNACLQLYTREVDQLLVSGRFDILVVEPVPELVLPFALAISPVVFGSIPAISTAVFAVALGLDGVRLSGVPMAFLVLAVGCLAILGIGIMAVSVHVLTKRSDPVLAVYLLAVQVLSGTFFPISVLPGPLQAVSLALPHTYILEGVRGALLGARPGAIPTSTCVFALLAFSAVVYPVALFLFHKVLRVGKRYGILSTY